MRKLSIILFAVFLLCFNGYAQKKTNQAVEFVKKDGSHNVKIIFKTKPFDANAHKIKQVGGQTIIDGKLALGTDGSIPRTEFESIEFSSTANVFQSQKVCFPIAIIRMWKKIICS